MKVQFSLDQRTLDLLDFIVQHVPDVESRSAAIRWAARTGAETIKTHEKDTKKTKP